MTSIATRVRFAILIAVMTLSAAPVSAQDILKRCRRPQLTGSWNQVTNPATREVVITYPNSFDLRCADEGITVRADSAVHNQTKRQLDLFGRVRYVEKGTQITSDHMRYYRLDDRVEADGNVVASLEGGSVITGSRIEYFPAAPPLYPKERLNSVGSPSRFMLVDRDTITRRADTTNVYASEVRLDGDLVSLSRNVLITSATMNATGDSAFANRNPKNRSLRLMINPTVSIKGIDSITLTGGTIDVIADSTRDPRQVKSIGGAKIVGKALNLDGDTIDLRLQKNLIRSAYAFGDSGARMERSGSKMTGDSLEIHLTDQRPTEIHALGKAYAELRDSTNKDSTAKDIVRGDTVVLLFENVIQRLRPETTFVGGERRVTVVDTALRDTTAVPRSLSAVGNAMMYYNERTETPGACPTIQYAIGSEIHARLRAGEIRELKIVPGRGVPLSSGATSECRANTPRRDATGGRGGGAGPPRIPPP